MKNNFNNRIAMKSFKGLMKSANKVLLNYYEKEIVNEIFNNTKKEFEKLMPDIPYVGGRKNFFNDMQFKAAVILALYRSLKNKEVSLEQYGKILEETAETYMRSFPKLVRKLAGKMWMANSFRKVMIKQASISQKRNYKDDFVYEIIHESEDYKWGINYIECGISKFLNKHNEKELAKYACVLDYVMFPAIGVNLKRTGTIATGCKICDFRFN